MKRTVRLLMLMICIGAFAAPVFAENEENLEKDAQLAEGMPPVIPHKVDVNATGESCLVCHKGGLKGAPITSHAMRMDCVQCHVQGEFKETKPEKKVKAKKSKAKQ